MLELQAGFTLFIVHCTLQNYDLLNLKIKSALFIFFVSVGSLDIFLS